MFTDFSSLINKLKAQEVNIMNKWKDNINNLDIPEYSKEQDDFNFYSHLIGVPIGIAIF